VKKVNVSPLDFRLTRKERTKQRNVPGVACSEDVQSSGGGHGRGGEGDRIGRKKPGGGWSKKGVLPGDPRHREKEWDSTRVVSSSKGKETEQPRTGKKRNNNKEN